MVASNGINSKTGKNALTEIKSTQNEKNKNNDINNRNKDNVVTGDRRSV